jgi:hypothetical protein
MTADYPPTSPRVSRNQGPAPTPSDGCERLFVLALLVDTCISLVTGQRTNTKGCHPNSAVGSFQLPMFSSTHLLRPSPFVFTSPLGKMQTPDIAVSTHAILSTCQGIPTMTGRIQHWTAAVNEEAGPDSLIFVYFYYCIQYSRVCCVLGALSTRRLALFHGRVYLRDSLCGMTRDDVFLHLQTTQDLGTRRSSLEF